MEGYFVEFDGVFNDFEGFFFVGEFFDVDDFVFEAFVVFEEFFDLSYLDFWEIFEAIYVFVIRVFVSDGDDFVVDFVVVEHFHNANDAGVNEAAWINAGFGKD